MSETDVNSIDPHMLEPPQSEFRVEVVSDTDENSKCSDSDDVSERGSTNSDINSGVSACSVKYKITNDSIEVFSNTDGLNSCKSHCDKENDSGFEEEKSEYVKRISDLEETCLNLKGRNQDLTSKLHAVSIYTY